MSSAIAQELSGGTDAGDTPTGADATPADQAGSDAGVDGQADTTPADGKDDQPKDTDKSNPDSKQDDVPEDGVKLTDDELKEFSKVGKHFVSYPKYAQTKTRLESLEKEMAEIKAQKA